MTRRGCANSTWTAGRSGEGRRCSDNEPVSELLRAGVWQQTCLCRGWGLLAAQRRCGRRRLHRQLELVHLAIAARQPWVKLPFRCGNPRHKAWLSASTDGNHAQLRRHWQTSADLLEVGAHVGEEVRAHVRLMLPGGRRHPAGVPAPCRRVPALACGGLRRSEGLNRSGAAAAVAVRVAAGVSALCSRCGRGRLLLCLQRCCLAAFVCPCWAVHRIHGPVCGLQHALQRL